MISEVLGGSRSWHVETGDAFNTLLSLPPDSVQTVITSPPYFGLRDYGVEGQIGLEESLEDYIRSLVLVFSGVRMALKPDGTVWLNLGDSFGKGKQLLGIPWRVALALQAQGWILRSDIIWHRPNVMPESVKDRPTKAHEYIFLLSKSTSYYYDADSIREPIADSTRELAGGKAGWGTTKKDHHTVSQSTARTGNGRMGEHPLGRNKRTVWSVNTARYRGAHVAVFPPDLIEPCVLAGSKPGDVILDPFSGSGTTGLVALKHGRRYLGIELNPEYVSLSEQRLQSA